MKKAWIGCILVSLSITQAHAEGFEFVKSIFGATEALPEKPVAEVLDKADALWKGKEAIAGAKTIKDMRDQNRAMPQASRLEKTEAAMKRVSDLGGAAGIAVSHVGRIDLKDRAASYDLADEHDINKLREKGERKDAEHFYMTNAENEPKEDGMNAALLGEGGFGLGALGMGLDKWEKAKQVKPFEASATPSRPKASPSVNPAPKPKVSSQAYGQDQKPVTANITSRPVDCEAPDAPEDKCPKEEEPSEYKWKLVKAYTSSQGKTAPDQDFTQQAAAYENRGTCHVEPGLLDDAHKILVLTMERIRGDTDNCSKGKNIEVTDSNVSYEQVCRLNGNDYQMAVRVVADSERTFRYEKTTIFTPETRITAFEEFERCD